MDDGADADAETDGDEINAAACGWNWGDSVNPIVAEAAAATVMLLTNDTNANVSNIFDVARMILDVLKLFIRLLNIVPMDNFSFLNPPAKQSKKRKTGVKSNIHVTNKCIWKWFVSKPRKHYDQLTDNYFLLSVEIMRKNIVWNGHFSIPLPIFYALANFINHRQVAIILCYTLANPIHGKLQFKLIWNISLRWNSINYRNFTFLWMCRSWSLNSAIKWRKKNGIFEASFCFYSKINHLIVFR